MADEKPKLSKAEKIARVDKKIAAKKDELKTFLKDNKLSAKEDHSKNKDKNLASSYKALKGALAELETKKAGYGAAPKKGGKAGIAAKYTYPASVKTSDDKKKYRTHIRALAKKNDVSVETILKDVAKYEAKAEKAKPAKKEDKPKKKVKEEEAPKKKKKAVPVKDEEEEEEETEEEIDEVEGEEEEEDEDAD